MKRIMKHSTKKGTASEGYQKATGFRKMKKNFIRDYQLYILCLPALIYFLVFCYFPMYGIQIAFKDFTIGKTIMESPWVGLKHFEKFIMSYKFWDVMKNTLVISFYSLIANFPVPIILALLLNQTPSKRFKKLVQTVTYAPHFISVVVLCGMITSFLSPSTGIVNTVIKNLGGEEIFFMASPGMWKHIYVWSGVWQGAGWGSIIYIAALSSVNPELYEAAEVDGATKLQKILNIDIPSLFPTMVIMLIMNMGNLLNVGFQKAYLLQNSLNISASEIINTYTYKIGLEGTQFSYSAAIGLFNTVINVILLVTANKVSKKLQGTSLW